MISAELNAKIRCLFFAEHWKIGTIAASLSVHPDAVRNVIESSRFNFKRVLMRQTLTDPYLSFIEQTLKEYPRLRATRMCSFARLHRLGGAIAPRREYLAPNQT